MGGDIGEAVDLEDHLGRLRPRTRRGNIAIVGCPAYLANEWSMQQAYRISLCTEVRVALNGMKIADGIELSGCLESVLLS